jgi:hypothetical protein
MRVLLRYRSVRIALVGLYFNYSKPKLKSQAKEGLE